MGSVTRARWVECRRRSADQQEHQRGESEGDAPDPDEPSVEHAGRGVGGEVEPGAEPEHGEVGAEYVGQCCSDGVAAGQDEDERHAEDGRGIERVEQGQPGHGEEKRTCSSCGLPPAAGGTGEEVGDQRLDALGCGRGAEQRFGEQPVAHEAYDVGVHRVADLCP